jgi:hypothetical protein
VWFSAPARSRPLHHHQQQASALRLSIYTRAHSSPLFSIRRLFLSFPHHRSRPAGPNFSLRPCPPESLTRPDLVRPYTQPGWLAGWLWGKESFFFRHASVSPLPQPLASQLLVASSSSSPVAVQSFGRPAVREFPASRARKNTQRARRGWCRSRASVSGSQNSASFLLPAPTGLLSYAVYVAGLCLFQCKTSRLVCGRLICSLLDLVSSRSLTYGCGAGALWQRSVDVGFVRGVFSSTLFFGEKKRIVP